jgi:UDP-N-acetylglucosamine acyltransferase
MLNVSLIHPTAIIDPAAKLADDVTVGAYSIIKGDVEIGAGSIVHEHTVLAGSTIIGKNCTIGPAAYVGMDPQHLRFMADANAPTYLVIGDNVIIRESARIHRSTKPGVENATRIGDNCFIMGSAHIGHDCVVDPDVTMADGSMLGGHVTIGAKAFLGGGVAIHQFVRVGRLAIISGNEAFSNDIPPFAAARYRRLKGYNAIGCKRVGMDRYTLTAIRAFYQRLRHHRVMSTALSAIRAEVPQTPEVIELVRFIESSRRGIVPSHSAVHSGGRETSARDEEAE